MYKDSKRKGRAPLLNSHRTFAPCASRCLITIPSLQARPEIRKNRTLKLFTPGNWKGGPGREHRRPLTRLRHRPATEAHQGWRGGGSEALEEEEGVCRPSPATQGACHPAHYRAFPPRSSFRGSREDPSGPHQPLSMHPSPPVPASPALSVSRSLPEKWRHEICPIDRSERTFTAHAHRVRRRALRYRSAPLSPALLAILLTGAFEGFVNLLRLYLLRDNSD